MGAQEPTATKGRKTFVFLSPTFNATVPIVANDPEGALIQVAKVDNKIGIEHLIDVKGGHTVAPREGRKLEDPGRSRKVPPRDGRSNDWEG
jgi:hypothetical protein